MKATEIGSDFWIEHILFRDALRRDQRLRGEYRSLKEQLAEAYASEREAYTNGKEKFVRRVIATARGKLQSDQD